MAEGSVCPSCEAVNDTGKEEIGTVYTCKTCGTQCIVPSEIIDPGMSFGDWVVKHPLGAGSGGEVHLAEQRGTGQLAAIKVLSVEAEEEVDVQRFLREARNAAAIVHPNVVELYDAGQEGRYYYLAMEYVKGETLDKMLAKHGSFDQTDALHIVLAVADAMRVAWTEKKLVHRDIKPGNIMLAYDGTTKVMDLGIAKSLMFDLTALTDPDMVIGSPPYMSPEQCSPGKRLDQRADIYSLGCTLYQLLTEEFAFEGDNPLQTLRMQMFSPLVDPRERNPDVSPEVAELIKRMMAKSASNRHADWTALIAEVHAILGD